MASTIRTFALAAAAFGGLMLPAANLHAAEELSPDDIHWIEACVTERAQVREKIPAIRRYCTCMHEVVEDNEVFESITALERTYPPIHLECRREAYGEQ